MVWEIHQPGEFKGVWLSLQQLDGTANPGRLTVTPHVGGVIAPKHARSISLLDLGRPLFVPGASPTVMYFPDKQAAPHSWMVEFRMEPEHLPTKYCTGRTVIDKPGEFSDGSGKNDYSPETNCFWHIKAPPGKVVQFQFTEFDTEPSTDLIYFFDGDMSNAEINGNLQRKAHSAGTDHLA